MKFINQTKNLNLRLYKRMIRKYIYCQLPAGLKGPYFRATSNYTVILRPHTMASEDPFFHGKDGVGDVTDREKMILYLHDQKTNLHDTFGIKGFLRTNANVISHAFGHQLLIHYNQSQRVALRNDDFSGNKKGKQLNFWTAEVHDRDTENFDMVMNFWFWDWHTFKGYKLRVDVLDFRDLFTALVQ